MTEFLTHPLFLLLVGGVISAFLVPFIGRIFEIQKKEIEIKTELATKIQVSIIHLIKNMKFHEGKIKDADTAYSTWITENEKITSVLNTYFQNDFLIKEWKTLYDYTSSFFLLFEVPGEDIKKHLEVLQKNTEIKVEFLDIISKKFYYKNDVEDKDLKKTWNLIYDHIQLKKQIFSKNLLNCRMRGLPIVPIMRRNSNLK